MRGVFPASYCLPLVPFIIRAFVVRNADPSCGIHPTDMAQQTRVYVKKERYRHSAVAASSDILEK